VNKRRFESQEAGDVSVPYIYVFSNFIRFLRFSVFLIVYFVLKCMTRLKLNNSSIAQCTLIYATGYACILTLSNAVKCKHYLID